MTFVHHGRALPLDAAAWAAAHPQATGKVAVFVHGLCCNESVWDLHRVHHDGQNYAERLSREAGFTPLFVRYNSGLGIADNGATLSQLLDGLMEVYPRRIQHLVLIGHSMGGLVARGSNPPVTCSAWGRRTSGHRSKAGPGTPPACSTDCRSPHPSATG